MELTTEEHNKLTKWIAVDGRTEIFDILKKLGFNDVGSVAIYLEAHGK